MITNSKNVPIVTVGAQKKVKRLGLVLSEEGIQSGWSFCTGRELTSFYDRSEWTEMEYYLPEWCVWTGNGLVHGWNMGIGVHDDSLCRYKLKKGEVEPADGYMPEKPGKAANFYVGINLSEEQRDKMREMLNKSTCNFLKKELKFVPEEDSYDTTVKTCPRCGGTHYDFLANELKGFSKNCAFWGVCPETGEPVIIEFVPAHEMVCR